MKFGDYIKAQREKARWTQPQAAMKIEIEQSYLSKLETGKSLPSEDVFDRILTAYGLSIEQMSQQLSEGELLALRHIKQVRELFRQELSNKKKHIRTWLTCSMISFVLAAISIAGFYVSSQQVMRYHYISYGVLEDNEALKAFNIVNRDLGTLIPKPDIRKPNPKNIHSDYFVSTLPVGHESAQYMQKELILKQREMTSRLDQIEVVTEVDRGELYYESGMLGKRSYQKIKWSANKRNSWSHILLFPVAIFLAISIMSVFLSFRWR